MANGQWGEYSGWSSIVFVNDAIEMGWMDEYSRI